MKKSSLVWAVGCVLIVSIGMASLAGCNLTSKEAADAVSTASSAPKVSNTSYSKSDMNSIEKYINLLGQSKEKLISALNETPVSIDEGGLEFKKEGIRVWFKDYGNGMAVSQIFTQKKDIDFNGVRLGDKISSFRKALGDPISDKNGETQFKYKDIFLSFNYDVQTEDTVCVYFLKEIYSEENALAKPKVEVPVDLKVEENTQKSVDAGHSPWRLDPVFVAQVFASLKISPEGVKGEYPIKYEELKITHNTGKDAVVDVNASNTPVSRVYLKRLIKQDNTGIWTVVGYDPGVKK